MLSQVNLRQIIPAILINIALTTSLDAQTVETNPDTPQLPPQDINPPPLPPPLPETSPTSPPSPQDLLPTPPTSPEEFLNTEETITVTEFIFTGNTLFTNEELETKFTKDLTNQPLSLNRLLQIANDIAQLYSQQGYSTSGAIISIPETTQQQGRGIVEVKIIEGELSEIRVLALEDDLNLNPDYIRSRLNLATSKPLNIYRLQEALQLLQLNPLIDSISATLSAGASTEQSILIEPVYRQLAQLLLQQPSQQNLTQVRQVIQNLQLAELENFLGCNLENTQALDKIANRPNATEAIVYPIILDEQIDVIVKLPNETELK